MVDESGNPDNGSARADSDQQQLKSTSPESSSKPAKGVMFNKVRVFPKFTV